MWINIIKKTTEKAGNRAYCKAAVLLFVVFCMRTASLSAQDIITLKNGEDIQAIVQEVGYVEIIYKRFDNPKGANYILKKTEVFRIEYANGSKDVFNLTNENSIEQDTLNTASYSVTGNKRNGENWNPDGIEMVYVEGTGGIKSFYIGKYEITQAQWQALMGDNPSRFKNEDNPVEKVSWNDIQTFIDILNSKTGRQYSLPTEEQWEYAANEGKHNSHYKYSGSNISNEVGWCGNNSKWRTHPVGQKKPNALGIYDMTGNVLEWCQDCDKKSCTYRFLRGGSWYIESASQLYIRVADNRKHRSDEYGFRIVLIP